MQTILHQATQLGPLLQARRRALKMSQADLAVKLAISQSRLSEIESDPAALSVERLLEIANLLGFELIIQDRPAGKSSSKVEW